MSSPVEVRVGSAGTGLFIGCGAGVGILTPISLHSIPVIGQIAGSLSSSLNSIDHRFLRVLQPLRGGLRLVGMDAGFGCGVALGYGWGAGLMLTPNAGQALSLKMHQTVAAVKAKFPALQALDNNNKTNSENAALSSNNFKDVVVPLAADSTNNNQQMQSSIALNDKRIDGLEDKVGQLSSLLEQQQCVLNDLQRQMATLQNSVLESQLLNNSNKSMKIKR